MNFNQDPMQNTQNGQTSQVKVKNTLSTSYSKGDTDIDNEENFKNLRQKYLQQKLSQRQQAKKFLKQKFGQSSSESQGETQKNKPKPKLVKDHQVLAQKDQGSNEKKKSDHDNEEKFKLQREKYLKQKRNQRQQIKKFRKQKFGSSSSQQQVQVETKNPKPKIIKDYELLGQKNLQLSYPANLQSQQTRFNQNKQAFKKEIKPLVYKQPQQIYNNNNKPSANINLTQAMNQINNQQVFNQNNPSKTQAIYSGSLYLNQNNTWQHISNICLTANKFGDVYLDGINKLKIKKQILNNDCLFLKTSHLNSTDNQYAVPKHQQLIWFCALIWAKLQLSKYKCDLFGQFNGFLEGKILRKSQFFGEWALRDVVIDSEGLKSYKNRNETPTTKIDIIPEIWTRFQLIQKNKGMYLVIKIHHQGTKYQYGIPLENAIVWLKGFYSLMK